MTAGPNHVGPTSGALECNGIRHALVATISLAAIWSAPARCADVDASPQGLRMPDALLSLRDMYPDLATAPVGQTTTREFQPRSIIARAPDMGTPSVERRADLQRTNAWQRLAEYRSDYGIRLLTVWRATAGTIALHEGKHGGTSLQWTSQMMSRSAASRGLLDQLVSAVRGKRVSAQSSDPIRPAVHEAVALRPAPP
jgi:hypothetical protein